MRAELVDADAVDQELDARAGAVRAQVLLAVEDAQHRLGDLQVLAVVDGAKSQNGAPTRGMIDVPPPVRISKPFTSWPSISRIARDEAEVVDVRDRAVLVGGRERDLELARQQLADLVAHEVAHERARRRAWGRTARPRDTPAHGSPVTLRTVLPQASRVERPASPIMRIALAASGSGMWWNWKFWRVVMWPLLSGVYSARRPRRRPPSARA